MCVMCMSVCLYTHICMHFSPFRVRVIILLSLGQSLPTSVLILDVLWTIEFHISIVLLLCQVLLKTYFGVYHLNSVPSASVLRSTYIKI